MKTEDAFKEYVRGDTTVFVAEVTEVSFRYTGEVRFLVASIGQSPAWVSVAASAIPMSFFEYISRHKGPWFVGRDISPRGVVRYNVRDRNKFQRRFTLSNSIAGEH